MIFVSFQGEHGSYSESAAFSYFNERIKTIPLHTFIDVLKYTKNDRTQYSIIPIENSLEGSIGENYDLLYSTRLTIMGEVYHRVRHCLIGIGSLEDLDMIYSHPQALGQCRKFIQKYDLKTISTYDTAGSVKIIKKINKKNIACIASKEAANIFKMPIIKSGIEDHKNNYTRFLILSKIGTHETGNDKTSIIFSLKHEPGALYKIIKRFYNKNINLIRIESRPIKHMTWKYNFYVDFEGHINNTKIKKILEYIKKDVIFLKISGSYCAAKLS